MYHISFCFSCVALFGPRVRGWNKADPILKLTGSPKSEPEGSPPAPSWQRPSPTKVQFVTSFWGGKKKEPQQGGLFGAPLTPWALWDEKAFNFYQTRKTTSAQNHSGLQSSAEILIRDKLLYIVWCTALHRHGLRGQRSESSIMLHGQSWKSTAGTKAFVVRRADNNLMGLQGSAILKANINTTQRSFK